MKLSQLRLLPLESGDGIIVDLFAGGGGASTGIEAALGRPVDVAVNHDRVAIETHTRNHPHTVHYRENVWRVRPLDVTGGRPVSLLWASPDCRHFSVAKGDVPKSKGVRSLANVVVRWARDVRPPLLAMENVREFLGWGPLDERTGKPIKERAGESFRRWKGGLENCGYVVDWRVLDCSLYGAPTRRKRLFIVARCDGDPIVFPEPTHGSGLLPLGTAADCIDWSIPVPSIFEPGRDLVEKTMWRLAQGVRRFVLENPRPFIVKVNHGRHEDRSESIDEPLSTVTASRRGHALVVASFLAKHYGDPGRTDRGGGVVLGSSLSDPIGTVTARDHHALVSVSMGGGVDRTREVRAFLTTYYGSETTGGQRLDEPMRTLTTKHRMGLVTVEGRDRQISDIGMRFLEPHELLRANFGRFAAGYDLSAAKSKAAKVRLIGNSVPPEMVEALIRANTRGERAVAA